MTATPFPSAARRVLLIDDDDCIRNVVVAFLVREGFEVDAIDDGSGALKQLAKYAYDLVITDIMMPNTDGLETIRKIRARQPTLQIIAMSGGDSYGNCYLRVAHLLGAASILQKPFELSRLGELVHSVTVAPQDARDKILLPT